MLGRIAVCAGIEINNYSIIQQLLKEQRTKEKKKTVPECTISLFLEDVLDAIYNVLQEFIMVPSTTDQ
ncbi:unnamed protein product [Euphydryas editha]|uniref:Uncharacterized protein n=1 Tax=Euphydryas editha TaxID=104508 RepID=A0AAU9U5S4_EUPED|nr:unnamed protein product [Euphydryas editha]